MQQKRHFLFLEMQKIEISIVATIFISSDSKCNKIKENRMCNKIKISKFCNMPFFSYINMKIVQKSPTYGS